MIFAGILTAVAVPALFLALVRWLDLYASGSFRGILICLCGGVVAFLLAFQVNGFFGGLFSFSVVVMFTAPIAEEILKSLVLVYAVRRNDFTYFVDGAIYGFASGTAFAVLENLFYLSNAGPETTLSLAVTRAFTTSLMHGSASALVGVALGRMRYGRGASRIASLLVGWAAAMTLHITYNNVVNRTEGTITIILAIILGLGGVGLIAGFIFWGLAEEKRWLLETLVRRVGVSAGESAVVQKLDDLDGLLAPVEEHFGAEKRKQVEAFLKLQAQLGLKRKVQQLSSDNWRKAELGIEITELIEEINEARRELGIYCMSYVRSILPPEREPIWSRLAQIEEEPEETTGKGLWGALGSKMEEVGQGDEETG